MAELPETSSGHHFRYLDSARGIAALMVFGSHFLEAALSGLRKLIHSLCLIFNGRDAVSFFFVLSGFVLSYKYIILKKPLDIRRFYVARIFRLFPAFFLIVVLNVLFAYRNDLSFHTLIDIFVFNKHQFWEEALMLRFHNLYYGPGWTLGMEMACSFMMPFYIALAIKDKRTIVWLYAVLLVIGNSFFFSTHFLLGIIITCYYYTITDKSFKETKWFRYRYFILPVAVIFFSIRKIDALFPLGPTYNYLADYVSIDFFFYTGLASFIFLGAIIHSKKAQKFLQQRTLVFIGKISYSIYLTHSLAIALVFAYFAPLFRSPDKAVLFAETVSVYIITTFIMSVILHYTIEIPFMRFGRRISNRLAPSFVIVNEQKENP